MPGSKGYVLAMLFLLAVCWAQADLIALKLEDLAKVEVTSASCKSKSLSSAPAAIYALTADAMQQGGFRNFADTLRMVPGLYVAQTNAHIWQISACGFSDLNNNKTLVLVDGRSVYAPLYGGERCLVRSNSGSCGDTATKRRGRSEHAIR